MYIDHLRSYLPSNNLPPHPERLRTIFLKPHQHTQPPTHYGGRYPGRSIYRMT